jgi:hypothetical protein
MIVNDLLDDGEAEAGALVAHGHVRLKQPVPVFTGQTAAVVDDVDTYSVHPETETPAI